MICYAVIDTNVLVSALLSSHEDAATVQVIGKLFSGQVIPLFSKEILREYDEVLPFIVTAREFLDILNSKNE